MAGSGNPLTDPTVPIPTGVMDKNKTTHKDAVTQTYSFPTNSRTLTNTSSLSKAPH